MAGSFIIKKARNDEYYFILQDGGNNATLATSEMYTRKDSAIAGARNAKNEAQGASILDGTGEK